MKILTPLIILGLASVALSAEDFTIQLLTANQKISMEVLVEKARNNGIYPEIFVGKNGRYILTVGTFKNQSDAQKEISHVKTISKDAFVRPIDPTRIVYLPSQEKVIVVNLVQTFTSVEVISSVPKIAEKESSVVIATTAIYLYDCNSIQSGAVVPIDESATTIIVRYNCNKLSK